MTHQSQNPDRRVENLKTCPVTGRPFFMSIELNGKFVPTYGGPLDSYTIPEECEDDEEITYTMERFCHDRGAWVGSESLYADDIITMLQNSTVKQDALFLEKEKEIREWRELVESIKQDHIKVVDELKGKEGEALKKAASHHANLLEYMHCLESVIGFAGPVEEVKKALQAKEERIKELEDAFGKTLSFLKTYPFASEFDQLNATKVHDTQVKVLPDYRKEEGE